MATAVTLTIFIHGTIFAFLKPLFHTLLFCPLGITPALNFDKKYHFARLAPTLVKAAPKQFSLDTFYYFGWSGELNAKARKKAAVKLYQALVKLQEHYCKKCGYNVALRLITHSHGGNVALNLAVIAPKYKKNECIIDELILLACPVQKETKDCIKSSCFKSVYSLHSAGDLVQILDPQGLSNLTQLSQKQRPLFSERLFNRASNLIQLCLSFDSQKLSHKDFVHPDFFEILPLILYWIQSHPQKNSFSKKRYIEVDLLFDIILKIKRTNHPSSYSQFIIKSTNNLTPNPVAPGLK